MCYIKLWKLWFAINVIWKNVKCDCEMFELWIVHKCFILRILSFIVHHWVFLYSVIAFFAVVDRDKEKAVEWATDCWDFTDFCVRVFIYTHVVIWCKYCNIICINVKLNNCTVNCNIIIWIFFCKLRSLYVYVNEILNAMWMNLWSILRRQIFGWVMELSWTVLTWVDFGWELWNNY